MRSLKNSIATPSTTAAVSPATCDRPPTDRFTAVRESDEVTGKPPSKPEAILAAPNPVSSALAFTVSPVRAPKLRAVMMPAPKLTTKTAADPRIRLTNRQARHPRKLHRRQARRQIADNPDARPSKSRAADRATDSSTTMTGPGTTRLPKTRKLQDREHRAGQQKRWQMDRPGLLRQFHERAQQAVGLDRQPVTRPI